MAIFPLPLLEVQGSFSTVFTMRFGQTHESVGPNMTGFLEIFNFQFSSHLASHNF